MVSKEWLCCSITRARDFNKVYFFKNEKADDEMFMGLVTSYFKNKCEGYKMQDRKKGREIDEMVYSDEERSLIGRELQDYFRKEGIKLHTTRGRPAFVERLIKTFKEMLFKRVDNDEKRVKKVQWTDYIFEFCLTYNNKMVSSITKMTPKDARMKKNELDVKMNISLQAKSNRKYPAVEVSDKVKSKFTTSWDPCNMYIPDRCLAQVKWERRSNDLRF